MAWSNGQHRRLPLQGSRVQTTAIPLFFVANIVRATARRDVKIPSSRKTARRSSADKGGSGERKTEGPAGERGKCTWERIRWFEDGEKHEDLASNRLNCQRHLHLWFNMVRKIINVLLALHSYIINQYHYFCTNLLAIKVLRCPM